MRNLHQTRQLHLPAGHTKIARAYQPSPYFETIYQHLLYNKGPVSKRALITKLETTSQPYMILDTLLR